MALEQISSTRTQTGFATSRGWARPSRLLGWLLAGLLSLGLWLGLFSLLRALG